MALDQRPEAVGAGEVRCALVEHEPRAEQQRPRDRPGTHHPAEVREPEQRVAAAEVELVGQVLRALDREAAVHVDRALRPAGRARGVDEHVGRLGVDLAADRRRRLALDRIVPPRVTTGRPGRVERLARAPDHQHPPDRRRRRDRLVGDGLERDPRSAAQEAVGGDQHRRLAVGEARRDGRRAVAAEDRRVDGLQPAERQHGDDRLDQHRQQDPDPVARPDAVGAQAAAPPPRPPPRARRSSAGGRPRPRPPRRAPRQSGSRAARGSDGGRARSRRRRRATSAPTPVRPRGRGPRVGRRSQAIPMSSAAAPQNQPGSAIARAWSASSDGSPVARRNRPRRAVSMTSRDGRHATPSPSRPKIDMRVSDSSQARPGRPR